MMYVSTPGLNYTNRVDNFYPVCVTDRECLYGLPQQEPGSCCIDEPRLPNLLEPIAIVTDTIDCIGSYQYNSARQWQHEPVYKRRDYSCIPPELNERLTKTQKSGSMAGKTFIFTNNHWRRRAVSTPRQLWGRLD
jgi:hypothetical protein